MIVKTIAAMLNPAPYAPGTSSLWDDPHISKNMLKAHLSADVDGATRKHDFVARSVEWIATLAPPAKYPRLLDLGCGPGIYGNLLAKRGYSVTGIDLSERSISYAVEAARQSALDVTYICQNYLELNEMNDFDVITLIYCDFGVLSDADRRQLLMKIYQGLKPGGVLIFDVFTAKKYEGREESST